MNGLTHSCKMSALLGALLLSMLACMADIQVELNGRALAFTQPPELINGRTMVPMRDIFEALGARVDWNNDTLTVTATRGATRVQLGIGKMDAMVNNQSIALDAPAMLLEGHTMVPLRFVSESLGANVQWVEATQTVRISANGVQHTTPILHNTGNGNQWSSTDNALSVAEMEDLLAPIALYPDPLLAQMLPAATFRGELESAAQLIPLRGGNAIIDGQDWDISVKAVAYYPSVLNMMARQQEWTTAIGQAYVNQPDDLLRAIQLLRAQSRGYGYLQSNAKQRVYLDGEQIRIVPVQSQLIYVPQYDSQIVYRPKRNGDHGNDVNFGGGLQIGVWLNRDVDWQHHKVYYHGWQGNGWVSQSRPHVTVNNTHYVNHTYSNKPVTVNRLIVKVNISTYIHAVKSNTVHVHDDKH